MWFQVYKYAVNPLHAHGAMEQNRLTDAADHAAEVYNAQNPQDRELNQAITIGALRGAALSRRLFGAATGISDAIFGAKLTLAPNYDAGVLPTLLSVPSDATNLIWAPISRRIGQTVGEAIFPPLTARLTNGPLNAAQAGLLGSQLALVSTMLVTLPCNIAASIGITCSRYTSATIKMATVAPLALTGAVVGAALHRLHVHPTEVANHMGARGERNDETFAYMEPTSSIPDAYFFLSEDRFGLDVRELAQFAAARGALINPHTNVAFSPRDVARLQAALPLSFGDSSAAIMSRPSLLSIKLWVKYFDTLVGIASSLGQSGPASSHHRALGCASLRQLLTSGDPIEAHALKSFIETFMNTPWKAVVTEVENDPSAAQNFAASLLAVCLFIGTISLGLSPQDGSMAEFLSQIETVSKREKEAANIYAGLRYPRIAPWSLNADELSRVKNPVIPSPVVENETAR